MFQWIVEPYFSTKWSLKQWELHAQRHRITVKKICIFSNSTVRMSYLAEWNLFIFAETSKPLLCDKQEFWVLDETIGCGRVWRTVQ